VSSLNVKTIVIYITLLVAGNGIIPRIWDGGGMHGVT
jgi:hypothetical protein